MLTAEVVWPQFNNIWHELWMYCALSKALKNSALISACFKASVSFLESWNRRKYEVRTVSSIRNRSLSQKTWYLTRSPKWNYERLTTTWAPRQTTTQYSLLRHLPLLDELQTMILKVESFVFRELQLTDGCIYIRVDSHGILVNFVQCFFNSFGKLKEILIHVNVGY